MDAGVVDEVGDDSLEAPRVTRQPQAIPVELHALLPAAPSQRGRDEGPDVDVLRMDVLDAGVET